MKHRRVWWRVAAAAFALSAATSHAATWYVNQDIGNDMNVGTPARPFETIGRGVLAAQSGDTVLVSNGIYTGYDNRNVNFAGKNIILRSAGGLQNCIIDCEYLGRAFVFPGGETAAATVEGFTVRNGTPLERFPARGGAVLARNASPTFRDCVFSGNGDWSRKYNVTPPGADFGGAFAMENSQSTFTRCVFQQNQASAGLGPNDGSGGAVHALNSRLSFTDCTFEGNSTRAERLSNGQGGAICVDGGALVLVRCQFANNSSFSQSFRGRGGAVFVSGDAVNVTDCTFTGNQASGDGEGGLAGGGALYARTVSAVITNCTFSGNLARAGNDGFRADAGGGAVRLDDVADGRIARCVFTNNRLEVAGRMGQESVGSVGGGLNVTNSRVTVDRSVFVGNQAAARSGFLLGGGVGARDGALSLTNCVVANNAASLDGGGAVHGGGAAARMATLTLTHCTVARNTVSSTRPPEFAKVAGGGVFHEAGAVTIRNSIVYANTARDAGANLHGDAITAAYSDIGGGFAGTGNINADPLFVSATDFHLQAASPARNAAAPYVGIPPTDLDGLPRIMGVAPDMGTYEVIDRAWFVDKATGSDTNPGTPAAPFKTVTKALSVAPDHAVIAVRAGNYGSDTPRITRPVRIVNWGGIGDARIGAP